MEYRPHEYQRYCTQFILDHPCAYICIQCGMGKTSLTLSAIDQLMNDCFEVSRVLVVAPLRVAKLSWPDEINKFDCFRHLSYSVAVGTAAQRKAALEAKADIYIINRENLQWLVSYLGSAFDFDMVVLDEISSFKNCSSKRFRAFMKVRPKVKRVVGLTGTPGITMDLFAQFKCLDMGKRLGRFISQYRNQYFIPDRMNGQVVYSYKPRPGAEEQIYERISDITISMKALDHLKMPELISSGYAVHMDDDEQAVYDQMKADLFLPFKDEEITAANAAALSGKLCQMANGCVYSDGGENVVIHDRKLDALEDIIESAGGEPVLAAYWYQHDLARIQKRLDALGVKYARLTSEENIRGWNKRAFQIGLIHPASAGHGLNLQQGGNHLVWFGLTWSLELYQQTVARLYRQGQEARTVIVQHIITAGTIDEKILKALDHKEITQNAMIDAVKAAL